MQKGEKEYQIRTYECDKNSNLRVLTLMNILQDMADSHASSIGLGLEFCLRKGFAWVGSNYHIKIERLPMLHENIRVVTWPSAEKKLGAVRDFVVCDASGNIIITASSQWILIDFVRKRPISLKENLPEYTVIPERALETDFPKLPEPERADCQRRFSVRFDDIDINRHVNNAVYPLWATEAVDHDFRDNHVPCELEIAFKKEGHLGEDVDITTELEGQTSLHSVTALSDGRELARLRIKWKNL